MAATVTLIGDLSGPALLQFGYPRAIAMIIPDVTIEEVHVDSLMITDHPIERGAAISDHAFLMPYEVTMTVAWANSRGGNDMYARQMYQELLELQAMREPFDVSTGKRIYTNMLIRNLTVTTNQETETTLMVQATMRRVIITDTNGGGVGMGQMANPASTAMIGDGGLMSLAPFA